MAHTPGIGALLGGMDGEYLDAFLPGDERWLATVMHRWFFETGDAVGPAGIPVSCLARVFDGWTGTIVVAVDGWAHEFAPPEETSAIEVLDLIVRYGSRRGGAWSWSMRATDDLDNSGYRYRGIATLSSTVPFELILSGTTRTRLGLLGTYAGQLTYSADLVFVDGDPPDLLLEENAERVSVMVPSQGLVLEGAVGAGRGGGITQASADVDRGAVGLERAEESGTVTMWAPYDELVDIEAELAHKTWDVGFGGEHSGRVRVRGLARDRRGPDITRCSLSAAVVAVSL